MSIGIVVNTRDGARDAYADEIDAGEVALLKTILELVDRSFVEIWVWSAKETGALREQYQ